MSPSADVSVCSSCATDRVLLDARCCTNAGTADVRNDTGYCVARATGLFEHSVDCVHNKDHAGKKFDEAQPVVQVHKELDNLIHEADAVLNSVQRTEQVIDRIGPRGR